MYHHLSLSFLPPILIIFLPSFYVMIHNVFRNSCHPSLLSVILKNLFFFLFFSPLEPWPVLVFPGLTPSTQNNNNNDPRRCTYSRCHVDAQVVYLLTLMGFLQVKSGSFPSSLSGLDQSCVTWPERRPLGDAGKECCGPGSLLETAGCTH